MPLSSWVVSSPMFYNTKNEFNSLVIPQGLMLLSHVGHLRLVQVVSYSASVRFPFVLLASRSRERLRFTFFKCDSYVFQCFWGIFVSFSY